MRFDTFPVGLISGLLFPIVGFFAYGLLYTMVIRPNHDMHWYVYDLFLSTDEFRTRLVSLSLIADAGLFFWFDRKGHQNAMRGVITALFIYALYIVPSIIVDQIANGNWS